MGALSYDLYRLGRKITRAPLLGQLIPRRLRSRVQAGLMSGAIDYLPDRRYMEETLLPAMVALMPRRVLDVGVAYYSAHYRRRFPADCEYWTLDLDPAVAEHGSPGRHIVGDALELAAYFEPASMDFVILNGTFGFGTDAAQDQERSIEAVTTVLRPGGWLMVGWDRGADGTPLLMVDAAGGGKLKDPVELATIRAAFAHRAPGALPVRVDFPDCSHVYDWFQRR